MDELVYKYLTKNYSMSTSNYLSGVVTDNITKNNLTIVDLRNSVEKVFSLPLAKCDILVTKWWDQMELPFIVAEMEQHKWKFI